MAMGGVGPAGGGQGDKVVAEVDEGSHVLPAVQVVVLNAPVIISTWS